MTDIQMILGVVIAIILLFAMLFTIIDGIYSDYKELKFLKSELDKINNK